MRPTYKSLAQRHNELQQRSNRQHLASIIEQLETLQPNQHFTIPHDIYESINVNTLRTTISQINKLRNAHIRLKSIKPKAQHWVWYDPTPRAQRSHLIAHESTSQSSGSIYAPLQSICRHLQITPEQFRALPWDRQIELRIKAGMAIRDQRKAVRKVNLKFNS